jgi:DNA-binding transcriptional MerR regulator
MLTIKDLTSQTGLSENVIRKYIRLFGSFLRPYIKRGTANKLLFDPNCLVIFQEVKKLKDGGKTAKEIITTLKKNGHTSKEISYQKLPSGQTGQAEEYNRSLQTLYQNLLAEKDKRIRDRDQRDLKMTRLEIQNIKLQESLKLLPGGKSPNRIRNDWDQDKRNAHTASVLVQELKSLSSFRFRKRKKLLGQLTELLG